MGKRKGHDPIAQQLIDSLLDVSPKGSSSDSTKNIELSGRDGDVLEKTVNLRVVDRPSTEQTQSVRTPAPESTPVPTGSEKSVSDLAVGGIELDKTMKLEKPLKNLVHSSAQNSAAGNLKEAKSESASVLGPVDNIVRGPAGEVRAPFGSGSSMTSADATLRQSESLRIAQTRISDLEQELEKFRKENEKLVSAGETMRRHADELLAKLESLEVNSKESEKIFAEEKRVMRVNLQAKDRELIASKQKLEELEGRLENNFKKIRVRERELEHRLEIVKIEHATTVGSKDKMILDLKRQIDQLTHESEYAKVKAHEVFQQFREKQDTMRKVVRALRLALSMLEGQDDVAISKKDE